MVLTKRLLALYLGIFFSFFVSAAVKADGSVDPLDFNDAELTLSTEFGNGELIKAEASIKIQPQGESTPGGIIAMVIAAYKDDAVVALKQDDGATLRQGANEGELIASFVADFSEAPLAGCVLVAYAFESLGSIKPLVAPVQAAIGETTELPSATIEELTEKTITLMGGGGLTLDVGAIFTHAELGDGEDFSRYNDYLVDFEITFSENCSAVLAGQYDYFNSDWFAMPSRDFAAGVPVRIAKEVLAGLLATGEDETVDDFLSSYFNYAFVRDIVKVFKSGVNFIDADDVSVSTTVKTYFYETDSNGKETGHKILLNTITQDAVGIGLAKAKITELDNKVVTTLEGTELTLDAGAVFTHPDITPPSNKYDNYIVDFEITFSEDCSAVLAGQYEAFNTKWLAMPSQQFTANTPVRIAKEVLAELLATGDDESVDTVLSDYFNYAFVRDVVKVFKSGVYIDDPSVNEIVDVKVELYLYETDAEGKETERKILLDTVEQTADKRPLFDYKDNFTYRFGTINAVPLQIKQNREFSEGSLKIVDVEDDSTASASIDGLTATFSGNGLVTLNLLYDDVLYDTITFEILEDFENVGKGEDWTSAALHVFSDWVNPHYIRKICIINDFALEKAKVVPTGGVVYGNDYTVTVPESTTVFNGPYYAAISVQGLIENLRIEGIYTDGYYVSSDKTGWANKGTTRTVKLYDGAVIRNCYVSYGRAAIAVGTPVAFPTVTIEDTTVHGSIFGISIENVGGVVMNLKNVTIDQYPEEGKESGRGASIYLENALNTTINVEGDLNIRNFISKPEIDAIGIAEDGSQVGGVVVREALNKAFGLATSGNALVTHNGVEYMNTGIYSKSTYLLSAINDHLGLNISENSNIHNKFKSVGTRGGFAYTYDASVVSGDDEEIKELFNKSHYIAKPYVALEAESSEPINPSEVNEGESSSPPTIVFASPSGLGTNENPVIWKGLGADNPGRSIYLNLSHGVSAYDSTGEPIPLENIIVRTTDISRIPTSIRKGIENVFFYNCEGTDGEKTLSVEYTVYDSNGVSTTANRIFKATSYTILSSQKTANDKIPTISWNAETGKPTATGTDGTAIAYTGTESEILFPAQ